MQRSFGNDVLPEGPGLWVVAPASKSGVSVNLPEVAVQESFDLALASDAAQVLCADAIAVSVYAKQGLVREVVAAG